MRLHGYWRSSSAWRVRIALGLKGIPFEQASVNLLRGEQAAEAHRARNPLGQVPVLELDDGAHLVQSVAILEYLEEAHPEPPLLPRSPRERAHVRALVEVVNSGIQPMQNLPVLRAVKALGGDDRAWVAAFVGPGLAALEALARPAAGLYLFGDRPTLADCCLVPQLAAARRFGVDLAGLPLLTAVEARLRALPAVQAADAGSQPDTPPEAAAPPAAPAPKE